MNKTSKTLQRIAILVNSAVLVMWVCNGVYRLRTGVTVGSYVTMWVALICYLILAICNLYSFGKQEQRISNAWAFADDLVSKYKVLNEAWRQTALRLKAQVPEWIPTTERMPEPNVAVIVRVKGDCWECVEFDTYDGEMWLENSDDEQHHITHWMPAPEWPEEEEHAEEQ